MKWTTLPLSWYAKVVTRTLDLNATTPALIMINAKLEAPESSAAAAPANVGHNEVCISPF